MADQSAVHRWVAEYNWDDGLGSIWPIVDSSETDYATALMIYWRLDGPWLEGLTSGVNAEARRLADVVKGRLLSGFYRRGALRYDPVQDKRLSKTQVYKLKKSGVPAELIEPEGQGGVHLI